MKPLRTVLLLGILELGWPFPATAGELLPYARRPNTLIAAIAKRGAARVVAELNEKESWAGLLDKIATGKRDWLLAALALLQGADGGANDDLRLAVSRALIPSASDVLDVFAGQVQAKEICWATAEFGGHGTLKSALNEAHAKIASVESARPPRAASFQAECLKSLRETASQLPSIYGASSP